MLYFTAKELPGWLVTWLLGAPLPRPLGEERGLGGKVRAGGEGTGYWVLGIGYWLLGCLVTWLAGYSGAGRGHRYWVLGIG